MNINGYLYLFIAGEVVEDEPVDDGCLADRLVSEEDDFELLHGP
jgi:hypothetical protein